MLFPWWIKYPNSNNEILNLDWLEYTVKKLSEEVANFITLNTIKYADPIRWDITRQYEKNTVVIEPNTGTAYISTQAVPSGVGITNEDYWNVIFTLDIISSNKNITTRDDGYNPLATFSSEVGEWLIWEGSLYVVTRNIDIGQAYVSGYNITRMTVELFLKQYIAEAVNAINTTIGSLDDLTTEDASSIVNAINELVSTIGDMSELTTSDKSDIVAAINELVSSISNTNTTFNNKIGDMTELDTTDKSDLVAAINETFLIANSDRHSVKEFGAKGDGVTDDTQAFIDALNTYDSIYIPEGHYLISSISIPKGKALYGDFSPEGSLKNGSWLYCTSTTTEAIITDDGVTIDGLNFYYPNQVYSGSPVTYPATIKLASGADRVTFTNIYLANSYIGVDARLSHEYLSIKRMYGYCIYRGIIDCNSTDIDRLETIHFNPNTLNQIYNSATVGLYNQWCRDNGIAFLLEHDDWILCFDLFCFGYSIGLQISETIASNPMGRAKFTNCGFDACGRTVYIIGASGKSHNGLVFDSCFFTANKSTNSASSSQYESIRIDYAIDVTFSSCRFWNTLQGAIVSSHCSSLIVNSCFFEEIGTSGDSDTIYEAIYVTSDTTYCNICNNTFFFENYYCNPIHLKSQTYGVVNGNGFININAVATAIILESCNYIFAMFNTFQSVTTAFSIVSSNNIVYSDQNHIIHTRGGVATSPINSTNVYKGSFYINENQAPCFKDMNGNVHTLTYT